MYLYLLTSWYAKVGAQIFFKSANRKFANSWGHSTIASVNFLGLQVSKSYFMINPQIVNPDENPLFKNFVPFMAEPTKSRPIFVRRNIMHLRFCRSLKSPNLIKRLSPQIANPQNSTFAECSQNIKYCKFLNLRTYDLRNLFADHPPLMLC